MALTATVTKLSYAIIKSSMGMVDCHDVIESPQKDNIFYGVIRKMTIQQLVTDLVKVSRNSGWTFQKLSFFAEGT